MVSSTAEAMRKAFADKGLDLTKKGAVRPLIAQAPGVEKAALLTGAQNPETSPKNGALEQAATPTAPQISSTRANSGNPAARPAVATKPKAAYRLQIGANARLSLDIARESSAAPSLNYGQRGRTLQCHGKDVSDEREVVLGLDFGTSAAKVVIGDAALGKSFAVPFADQMGIESYLLPCRLYESDGVYSLHIGDQIHRDLKLALIAEPTAPALQARVVAFLALVIRHARGWLFAQHADIYRNTRLVWKLVVGLPAATHLNDDLSRVFAETSLAAWLVAGGSELVDRQSVDTALLRSRELKRSTERRSAAEDVEVDVVPEIAAQIYGFVNSTSFDKKAENIFLMVDVGAGSVDSSLFHVRPARGGKWDFEFFTSVVEPHGAMNLHRHRIRWWEEALANPDGRADGLAQALNRLKFPTDRLAPLPDSYSSYFDDVKVTFDDNLKDPDEVFFAKKVLTQVRGQTYWRTWKDGFLPQSSLQGIPVFFCGGGTRLPFYQRLRAELQSMPNFSWLKASPRLIDIPQNLEAPGLLRNDFDRLTVAYGLSFLEVGKITKSIPQPKLTVKPVSSWREAYVDKDHC